MTTKPKAAPSYTPGPWRVGIGCSDQILANGKRLLRLNDDISEWLENGRLISAAPDLLRAAKQALEELPDAEESVAVSMLAMAIAKAEGREISK